MSLTLGLALAAAAGFADLAAIDRQVAEFTGVQIGQDGGAATPVDRRLRLNACISPLALTWNMPRRDSVQVRCPDAGGWRLFVPVRAAQAAASAAPAVTRGDPVTIAVEGEGFAVSQPGEALETGPVGAWIRVRALSANTTAASRTEGTRARIVRPGLVSIPLN